MQFPNEPLPAHQFALDELVDMYRLAMEPVMERGARTPSSILGPALNTVLCGRWPEPKSRMSLNVLQGQEAPEYENLEIWRDIDSMIGISDILPYTTHLAIFPLPSFRDIQTKPLHIDALAFDPKVC